MGGPGSGPRYGIDGVGQYKTHGTVHSVRYGLWRPGEAFFQIGLGCVMSHHQSPHRGALHIPVVTSAGKIQNGVPANSWSLKRIPCHTDLSKLA